MEAEVYNPLDTSLQGSAQEILRDPRVTMVHSAGPDAVFDPTRKQQTWSYPPGTGDVDAFQIRVSPDGVAHIVDYFIPAEISTVPNIQQKPGPGGTVTKYAPVPLRQLREGEKLVLLEIRAPLLVHKEWWIRVGEPSVPAPSPAGGSFTDDDRRRLARIEMLVSKLIANQ